MRKPTAPARKKLVTNKPVLRRRTPREQAEKKLRHGFLYGEGIPAIGDANNSPDVISRAVDNFTRPVPMRFTPDLVINTNKNEYYLPHLEVPMTLDQVSEYVENQIATARKLTRGEDITSLVVTLVVHED